MAQRSTFLTGSTGFIGQYVLRGLLQRGERIVVMLRGSVTQSALRLSEVMAPLGVNVQDHLRSGQLLIVSGTLPGHIPSLESISIHQIVHSAACLQVHKTLPGEPFATNFRGVRALAAWADAHGVKDFHFVSTAYTCGRDRDKAQEVYHLPRPRFVTDYELSKWLAEDYLRGWSRSSGRRLTVLRPGLVIGDSRTGFTTQYGGFYQLARMIQVLVQFFRHRQNEGPLTLPMRIPADPNKRQNLVPVDYVASAIVEIVGREELYGRVYHLTNPDPPTNNQIKSWLEDYYEVCGGHFVAHVDAQRSESLAERMFLKMNDLILRQFRFVPEFDCTNTRKALDGTSITFPRLDRDLAFRLLDYAATQKWGREARAAS